MKILLTIICGFASFLATAQVANTDVQKGNEYYRKGDYKMASQLYQIALGREPGSTAAKFNLGNALQKQQDVAGAVKQYEDILATEKNAALRAKTYYNKGVALTKQNDNDGAIDAFKHALGLAPDDNETRENLQKALNEQKQKQQQQKQPQNKKDPKKNNQPQPPKTADKQMMEKKFRELQSQEKQLQKQLQKKSLEGQPDKDW